MEKELYIIKGVLSDLCKYNLLERILNIKKYKINLNEEDIEVIFKDYEILFKVNNIIKKLELEKIILVLEIDLNNEDKVYNKDLDLVLVNLNKIQKVYLPMEILKEVLDFKDFLIENNYKKKLELMILDQNQSMLVIDNELEKYANLFWNLGESKGV